MTDPARVAEDGLLLLTTGRVAMAHGVLVPLPALIREGRLVAMAEVDRLAAEARDLRGRVERERQALAAFEAKVAARQRDLTTLEARIVARRLALAAQARPPRRDAGSRPPQPRPPRPPTPRQVLAAALASGRIDVGEVAMLLQVRPVDVEAIAEGRVGLASTSWRRVLRALAA